MMLLELHGLHKRYGQREVLAIDKLALPAGCAVVLTGMNGAGKSSLLRVLAGLEPAQCAAMRWKGEALRLQPYPAQLRAQVTYVHQQPLMFATTVAANVAYGLRARHVAASEMADRADAAMAWAGVAHLRARQARTLSGGEMQRVALARARALDAQLLLLDEPTANLDGAAREQVLALIPDLAAQGASLIVACHDRDLIALPGIRRWKLRDGALEDKSNQGDPV
ncbi:MAG TPA: energy-coupling factor ABC transporter ATP-binding protein [Burkholderiaceae bacterium]